MRLRRRRTWLERTVGVKRARRLRRRVAYAAFGAGVMAMKPTLMRTATVFAVVAGVVVGIGVLRLAL